MGITDLKTRMRDIPGIGSLTMQMLGGRQTYGVNGHLVALDAGASELEAEKAIRAALASDAVFQMPAGVPALPVQRVAEPSPSATLIPPVTALAPAPSQPKATAMSVTGAGAAGLSLKALFEKQKAKIAADLAANMAKIESGFEKQNAAVAAVGNLGDKVHAEADDLMASVGQFTNDLTGEIG